MSVEYVFADEAGNFDFSRGRDASRYVILTTVVADSDGVEEELLRFRRDLVWRGIEVGDGVHATSFPSVLREPAIQPRVQHAHSEEATVL